MRALSMRDVLGEETDRVVRRAPRRRRCLAPLVLILVLAPGLARAQLPAPPSAPTEADVAQAREYFVRGIELAGAERWEAALAEFLRSYALSGSPVALFNAASALRTLERFVEARAACEQLLADPELDDTTRAAAEALRRDAAAMIARVTVEEVPDGLARVTADGRTREERARPIEVELDPGARTLRVELPAYRPWRWSGSLAPGARLRLDAELAPEPGGDDTLAWVLGTLAVVVAAAVVTAVVVDLEAQLDPRTPLVITLP